MPTAAKKGPKVPSTINKGATDGRTGPIPCSAATRGSQHSQEIAIALIVKITASGAGGRRTRITADVTRPLDPALLSAPGPGPAGYLSGPKIGECRRNFACSSGDMSGSGAGTDTAKQEEHPNRRKREAEDDQADGDELLVVRLALRSAVRDQEEQPKERGGQNADDEEHNAEEDSDDRFHRAVTAESLRGLDVDHQSGGI
jgi:hypothetical protein